MLKTLAIIAGIIFLAIGVLGFVPAVTPDNLLLGIFHVNAIHNIVHLLSGAIALWVGFTSEYASLLFFRIFGVVYAIVAILGFIYGNDYILGILANNTADTWLHTAIAVVSLYLGFGYNGKHR